VVEKLMDEQIYPVCSPGWLARNGPLKTPNDLSGKAFIHDLSVDTHIGFASWSAWLQRADAAKVGSSRGMRVNNSAAVLQAAIDGHGVALARSVMARDDVVAGRLVRLFPEVKLASELAYYVVYPTGNASLPKLQVFRDWLMQETSGFA
jgi:LysR family glycine cleavage system transcriptional activator